MQDMVLIVNVICTGWGVLRSHPAVRQNSRREQAMRLQIEHIRNEFEELLRKFASEFKRLCLADSSAKITMKE